MSSTSPLQKLYLFYGKLKLEPESHSWFDRSKWPKDFESESGLEEDYFFEAIEKRFLVNNQNNNSNSSNKENCWIQAATREHWPFWAKLKNRPSFSCSDDNNNNNSFYGKYQILDADSDSDYVSVFAVNNKHQHQIIKWQTRIGETPVTLYRQQKQHDDNNKSLIIFHSFSNNNKN